jgi:hypothetical protein
MFGDYNLLPNVILAGDAGVGKSFVVRVLEKLLIPGTWEEEGTKSA